MYGVNAEAGSLCIESGSLDLGEAFPFVAMKWNALLHFVFIHVNCTTLVEVYGQPGGIRELIQQLFDEGNYLARHRQQ
jgi:hypothetical protein